MRYWESALDGRAKKYVEAARMQGAVRELLKKWKKSSSDSDAQECYRFEKGELLEKTGTLARDLTEEARVAWQSYLFSDAIKNS